MPQELEMSVKRGVHKSLWLHKRWQPLTATFVYQLIEVNNLNGYSEKVLGSGDETWAERQSKHYGLKIVDGPEL